MLKGVTYVYLTWLFIYLTYRKSVFEVLLLIVSCLSDLACELYPFKK